MNLTPMVFLKLFGSPVLEGADGVALAGRAAQRHRIALLSLLVLAPSHRLSRDKLIAQLWPESDPERGRNLLNVSLYVLRTALGERAILSEGDDLRLDDRLVQPDVAEFESAIAREDHASAVALYRGPFLDGFFLSESQEFERWVERERGRFAGEYEKALEELAEAAEHARDFAVAAAWWKTRAVHDPYDSRVALRLMEALEASGNRAGALQHATVHRRLIQEELGIVTAPEVEALAERLRGEPVMTPASSARGQRDSTGRGVNLWTQAAAGSNGSLSQPTALEPTQPRAAEPLVTAASRWRVARPRYPGRPSRLGYAVTAVMAATFGASAFWLSGRDSQATWLLQDAVPRIERHLDVADWESAYALAREAEQRAPDSRELTELWPRITWRVTIRSEPAGARVFRQAYGAATDQWEELGRAPLVDIRIPYGLSRLRFELEGYRPLVRALGGGHLNWTELTAAPPDMLLVGPEIYRLDRERTLPSGMVRVSEWKFADRGEVLSMRDFFLGRYEVTNAEYRTFVEAGGYVRPTFWDPVVVNGDTLAWSDAMVRFVDRTGRPGPSTWEAGDYPDGEGDFPVSGVSWYEASAYARFAGRELPTAHHWQQALANAMFPWLLPVSNFSGRGPRRVIESRAMSHVGAFDMAGNVREWTSTAIGDERVILGGSWNDPYYIAGTTDTSAPMDDRSPGNGIRLAMTADEPALAARVRAPIPARTTVAPDVERPPVSREVYAAYSRVFDYDRGPLRPAVVAVDTTRVWIRERLRFDAGYDGERMLLHLYLPTGGSPPYQTVLYWPGWDTFALDNVDEYFAKQVDFIVKSGRAVAFPVFRGTFERRVGSQRSRPEFGTAEYRDNTIHTVKELRRTVDYLETRRDIDRRAFALFGYSWGGVNGPVALAQEPRIRVGVIQVGLLPPMAATPEVDPVNALPRVRVPTLLLSGEFDPMVPMENARRYFEMIGTPAAQKRHVIAIGGHFIPRDLLIRESLDWLDLYLGRASR